MLILMKTVLTWIFLLKSVVSATVYVRNQVKMICENINPHYLYLEGFYQLNESLNLDW